MSNLAMDMLCHSMEKIIEVFAALEETKSENCLEIVSVPTKNHLTGIYRYYLLRVCREFRKSATNYFK